MPTDLQSATPRLRLMLKSWQSTRLRLVLYVRSRAAHPSLELGVSRLRLSRLVLCLGSRSARFTGARSVCGGSRDALSDQVVVATRRPKVWDVRRAGVIEVVEQNEVGLRCAQRHARGERLVPTLLHLVIGLG